MIKEVGKYGSILLVCVAGIVLPIFIAAANGYESVESVCVGICCSLVLVAIMMLIPNRIGRWIVFTVLFVFSIIEIIHTIVYYGDIASAGYIRSLFMTTPYEADGALSTIIRQNIVNIVLLASYYLGTSILLLCFQWKQKIGLTGLGIILLIALAAFGTEMIQGNTMNNIIRHVPWNVYTQSAEAIRQVHERNNNIGKNDDFVYGAVRDSIPAGKEIYVLVIDESLSYSHLSIGGYSRETTPNLERMQNVVSYTNYTAPAVFTMYAVPLLLTPSTPSTFADNYSMKGVQQAYKECGFATYWITHAGQLVNDGESSYVADGVDEIISVQNDSCVPTVIDSLARKHDKLFMIVHLWGSHQHYANATQTISRYTPNRLQSKEVCGRDLFVNSYDNTVLYTDSILGALTNVLEQQNAIAQWMFVSDHGEGDIGEKGGAHGYTIPQESEYHVPFIIWYSNKYKDAYPKKVTNIWRYKNKSIYGDCVFWSVLDMAGVIINRDLLQEGMSIYGDTLLPHKRELLLSDGKSILTL